MHLSIFNIDTKFYYYFDWDYSMSQQYQPKQFFYVYRQKCTRRSTIERIRFEAKFQIDDGGIVRSGYTECL